MPYFCCYAKSHLELKLKYNYFKMELEYLDKNEIAKRNWNLMKSNCSGIDWHELTPTFVSEGGVRCFALEQ